jgi:hypothetical protein
MLYAMGPTFNEIHPKFGVEVEVIEPCIKGLKWVVQNISITTNFFNIL